ncbi:MAG: hypothetical protein M3Q19_00920 [Pseudomonadota bacterium]|nr:hypothetical protein [Pseudomonadota bacterium]
MSEVTPITAAKRPNRKYMEKIGDREWEFEEVDLDIYDDVTLWSDNPRLETQLPLDGVKSEIELEAALVSSKGYDNLLKSIEDIGQMEAIYVQRLDPSSKALVYEGATRLTILRQLDRKHVKGLKEGKFRRVRAKLLPADFGEREVAILLARIHVRTNTVRHWGRYIEAKFIHETVVGSPNKPALMNVAEMARHMEKSTSWVQRLRDAYAFARAYIDYVDEPEGEGERIAHEKFSVLEEASKARIIGSWLREYDNPKYDALRADVFEMVRNDAFKEYRDARFLKDFHDDPEKWSQLKSGEKHIAARLALEIKTNTSSVKARIAALGQQVARSLDRDEGDLGEEEAAQLRQAAEQIENHVFPDVRPFRVALRRFTTTLEEASMADVKVLEPSEVKAFREALDYFEGLYTRHGRAA